jgi:hypothetical protein
MHTIEQIFINGEFVTPHGTEWFDLYNPATAQVIGQVRLADEVDAERAVAAAKAAFPAWSQTTKQERLAALKRMHAAVAARHDDLLEAVIEEYGAPASRSAWMASYPAEVIAQAIEALEAFEFVTPAGAATVQMTPLGVAGLITPWNSDGVYLRQAGGRAGCGLYGGHQAERNERPANPDCHRSAAMPRCRRACLTSSPDAAKPSVKPSAAIRTWQKSRLPARRIPARRSCATRRRALSA